MSATAIWWMIDLLTTFVLWYFGMDEGLHGNGAKHDMGTLPGYLLCGWGFGWQGQLVAGIIDGIRAERR